MKTNIFFMILGILIPGAEAYAMDDQSYRYFQVSIFETQCETISSEAKSLRIGSGQSRGGNDPNPNLSISKILDILESAPRPSVEQRRQYQNILNLKDIQKRDVRNAFRYIFADCWQESRLKLWKSVLFEKNLSPEERKKVSLLLRQGWDSGISARNLTVMADLKIMGWALENSWIKVDTGLKQKLESILQEARKKNKTLSFDRDIAGFVELFNTIILREAIFGYHQNYKPAELANFQKYLIKQTASVKSVRRQISNWLLKTSGI